MSSQQLHAVFIAVDGDLVLLPHAAVIETVGAEALQRRRGSLPWWIGDARTDGGAVPVVSIEALLGRAPPAQPRRIVVIQSLGTALSLGRIGLAALGHPQLVTLGPAALAVDEDAQDEGPVLARVRVGSARALIPDLDAIERALAEQLQSARSA